MVVRQKQSSGTEIQHDLKLPTCYPLKILWYIQSKLCISANKAFKLFNNKRD